MSRYEIMPAAKRDLTEIEDHIAADNPEVARRIMLEMQATMQMLTNLPKLGHRRSDIHDPRYRFYSVYSWLIVYNPSTDPLQILRVVHGRRDLPSTLP